MSFQFRFNRWLIRFGVGFLLWIVAVFLGLITQKGSVKGIFSNHWFYETGTVYLLWGFLNYLIFFGLIYFIIPTSLASRKYARMIAWTYALIFAVGFIKYYFVTRDRFEYVFVSHYLDEEGNQPVYYTLWQYLRKTLFTGTFVSVLAYAWGLTLNWIKGEKQRKELETRQLVAELSFLRMQLNPHFLFNSLNSIYSLSLKKSDDTPQAVLKLSEMMRYMLYEQEDDKHTVPLNREIDYLQNYIGLQKIRYKDQVHIEFLVEGSTDSYRIVPMLLIPFVENGFKHGVLNDSKHPLIIQLVMDGNRMLFYVQNKKNLDNKDFSGGIGMDNVRRRLALIYPGKHQLQVTDDNTFFRTELILFL